MADSRQSTRWRGRIGVAALLGALAACGAPAAGPDITSPVPTGAPVALTSPANAGAGEANLFATADGRVHMSWLEPAGGDEWAVRTATLTDDHWSETMTIARSDSFFVNWADFPSLIELPGGDLVAHWLQRSGDGTYAYDVMLSRSGDGGSSWSEPTPPHEDATQTEHGFVSLVPDSGGGFTAVWLDGRNSADRPEGAGGEMTLRSRRFGADGTAGPEELLDPRICDCCQTSAAYVGERLLVAYRDRSDEEIRDIQVISRGPEGWGEPVTIGPDGWMIPGCPVNGPALASSGDLAAVAWFGMVDQLPEVKVSFTRDAGASFQAPILLERGTATEATLGRVGIVWLDGEQVLVSWLTGLDKSAEIRYQVVTADGQLGAPGVLAETSPSRSSGFPRLAADGDRVVAAWRVPGEPAVLHVGAIPLLR